MAEMSAAQLLVFLTRLGISLAIWASVSALVSPEMVCLTASQPATAAVAIISATNESFCMTVTSKKEPKQDLIIKVVYDSVSLPSRQYLGTKIYQSARLLPKTALMIASSVRSAAAGEMLRIWM